MLSETAPEPSISCQKSMRPIFAVSAGLDENSAGAVAEEDAGGAVGVVDDGAHDVGADDEDFFVRAGFDELGADLEGVGEAGAGGGEVEAPGAGGAELVLDDAGGGGEDHVGRDGGDDDGFDFGGLDAAGGEAAAGGFDGEVAGGDAFVDEMTLADAGALDDPLVVGFDHLFEVCVGEDPGWNVSAEGGDFGADGRPGLQGETQNVLLQRNVTKKNLIAARERVGSWEKRP